MSSDLTDSQDALKSRVDEPYCRQADTFCRPLHNGYELLPSVLHTHLLDILGAEEGEEGEHTGREGFEGSSEGRIKGGWQISEVELEAKVHFIFANSSEKGLYCS